MNFVPGRIEFLGKHTDYGGGESLVCPIGRGFSFEFTPRADSVITLENRDRSESLRFGLDDSGPRAGWINYAITVAARLRSNFGDALHRGVDISFSSDLPPAAGLSSSSALMIMVFRAIAAANDLERCDAYAADIKDELDLAEYLGCVENGQTFRGMSGTVGVGTFGGSQDHAAIIAGRRGFISRFSFGPLARLAELEIPPGLSFAIASSGVLAEKTGAALAKYNRVSEMVSAVTAHFGATSLAALIRDRGIDEVLMAIRTGKFAFSSDDLIRRVAQFHLESCEILPKVAAMISSGQIDAIGDLIDQSQQFAESMLGNQVDETMFLQRSARKLGAVAASAFGAGFGGSVYALIQTDHADAFLAEWQSDYRHRFPHREPEFFLTPM